MEILVSIIVLIVAISLFMRSSHSTPTSTSSYKRKKAAKMPSVKVSDFIPKEKNENDEWCTQAVAYIIIEKFAIAIGAHDDAANLYKEEFRKVIDLAAISVSERVWFTLPER